MDSGELKRYYLYARGYSFLARHIIAGKIVDKALEVLAFLDYRLYILLCLWHPDMETRVRMIRKRGVNVGEHVFIDYGVWIDVTHPDYVIIEDYASLGYCTTVLAHDAGMNQFVDMPLRAKPTRIGYNCAIAPRAVIMPGVSVGKHCGVLAGSVVTKDVPDGAFVGGSPAKPVTTLEELIKDWQEDMKVHPEYYYDHPHGHRAPSTPWDHLVTWRKEGVEIQPATRHRTGTPFDYILDAKQMTEEKKRRSKG